MAKKSLRPLSSKFGFDRGKPIDRYWIEEFLDKNQNAIRGRVLEVTDPLYTKRYGGNRVTKSDVLDINTSNKLANIHGDLRNLKKVINDNIYDCIILTHVLGLVDDYPAAISEIRRILKPDGVLLFTGSCLGPILGEEVYWRFTPYSTKYIFDKHFSPKYIEVASYGNVLAGQSFWVGMAQEDLSKDQLELYDKRYPCIVSAIVIK